MSYSDDEEEVLELIKPTDIKIKMDLGEKDKKNGESFTCFPPNPLQVVSDSD